MAEDDLELLTCFHIPSVEIKGVHHHTQLILGLRSGPQAC